MEEPAAPSALGARYPELLAEVFRTGRHLDRPEPESLHALGERAAEAEAGYVHAEAARRPGVSVRTPGYRMDRIKTLTGHDPSDALHRHTLETAAMGAHLLGRPQREL